ncbi:putative Rubredoxin-like domain-containing protein [Helianthus anomalus]
MASAASVTFRLNQPSQSHSLKSKPHFTFPFKPLLTLSTYTNIQSAKSPQNLLMLEEKFAVLNTGIYECRSCGYLYNEAAGYPSYPIAPGLSFYIVPDDWRSIYQCLRKLWMNSVTKLRDEFYLLQ